MIQSLVFGLGHRARHGKDAAAAAIIERRSGTGPGWYDIRRYAFATELKREVNKNAMGSGGMIKLFGDGLREEAGGGYMQTNGNFLHLPEWVQYDPDAPMDDPECPLGKQRTLLQWWGGEYRRGAEPDYWIKRIAARIEAENPEIALITDMRYQNEMAFCMEHGETIKVERISSNGMPYRAPGVVAHASEEELAWLPDSSWSAILTNDGSLEELQDAAVATFDKLLDQINDGTL
jgi:hypothetical protein